jgi:hypothetical protein
MFPPTHLNEEEYLAQWHCENEAGSTQIWIQTSKEGKPEWVRLGDLYERSCCPEYIFNIIRKLVESPANP